jgi:gamma-glutamyl-gamma-aminobutyrate hydrolase PuuD
MRYGGDIPRIGITSYPRVVDIVTGPTLLHTANKFYVESVVRAGGVPVILPAVDPALAGAALGGVDGLVLPGGGDVDPASYGETPAPEVDNVNPDRDAWELACAHAALDARLPMLATCRGVQVLNVALGGSLVQHLPVRHGFAARYREGVHPVRLDPGCRLAAVFESTEVAVNSLHHQAVDRLGSGVRAVGWADDGTVEAVEVDDHPEVIAVQWHPELMEDPQQALFRELIALTRVKKRL